MANDWFCGCIGVQSGGKSQIFFAEADFPRNASKLNVFRFPTSTYNSFIKCCCGSLAAALRRPSRSPCQSVTVWHERFAPTHGDLPHRPHRPGCSRLARSGTWKDCRDLRQTRERGRKGGRELDERALVCGGGEDENVPNQN